MQNLIKHKSITYTEDHEENLYQALIQIDEKFVKDVLKSLKKCVFN